MSEIFEYRSSIQPRAMPLRSSGPFGSTASLASGGRILKNVTETITTGYYSGSSPFGNSAASTIRDNREREKKELSQLNDRLASFIEKVRFLEAQNRKLGIDLENLQGKTGKGSANIQIMHEKELTAAKSTSAQAEKNKKKLAEELKKLEKEVNDLKEKYLTAIKERGAEKEKLDDLLVTLSNLEAEITLLKRRIALLESDVDYAKKENKRFQAELSRIQQALSQETLFRIDNQNQLQTLLEETEFLRRHHDEIIRDLQSEAARDTTNENREFFKNELTNAIRDIRNEYDALHNTNTNDMESWYRLKVQEIETQSARAAIEQGHAKEETTRLKQELIKLKTKKADLESNNAVLQRRIEDLSYQNEDEQREYEDRLAAKDAEIRQQKEERDRYSIEFQMLLDNKQNTTSEIALYRKMLDGDEGTEGLRHLVEQVVKTQAINEVADTETMRVVKGETSSHQAFSKTAQGNVSIKATSHEGKFVVLENTHRSKEEPIGEWKLKRKIDNKREILFTFPKDFVLLPLTSVKIWARNQGGVHNPPNELVFDGEETFGVGNNVDTILYNVQGEKRATATQRQSQSTFKQ